MKSLIFIVLLLTSFACVQQTDLPKGILSENKMVDILVDYHIQEQLVAKIPENFDTLTTQFHSVYFPEILTKHQVSKEDFYTSYNYYCTDLTRFEGIYTEVENILQKETAE